MTTTISGTNGIDKIAAEAIEKADLPAGTVLQVVQNTFTGAVFSSSSTPADTGLLATITPTSASSKILVMISHGDPYKSNGNSVNSINILLARNSTGLINFGLANGFTGAAEQNNLGPMCFNYVDSPATTSSTTYKTQFSNYAGSVSNVGLGVSGAVATMILMEIAA